MIRLDCCEKDNDDPNMGELDSCDPDNDDPKQIAFKTHCPGEAQSLHTPSYTRILRPAHFLIQHTPAHLFNAWRQTGMIFAQVPGNRYVRDAEYDNLIAAYTCTLRLGPAGTGFRDALVDAVSEVMDDIGFCAWTGGLCNGMKPFDAAMRLPDCGLKRIFAWFCAIVTYPERAAAAVEYYGVRPSLYEHFNTLWLRETAALRNSGTLKPMDLWERYLNHERCRFHEHGPGKCWRQSFGHRSRPMRPRL